MIETPEWQHKIDAAKAVIDAEATEAAAMMRTHEGKTLDFCQRLLAITRVVLEEKRAAIPDKGWPVVAVSLFVQMLSVLRTALTAAAAGHGREVPIVTRPALEALITFLFIADRDQEVRARRWVDYTFVAKKALLAKHADLFAGPEHEAARRRVEEQAERVAPLFPGRFWASGLDCSDLRMMASKVDLLWHYDTIYWTGSQPTHATAIAVDEIIAVSLEDAGPVYKVGLSGKDVRRELVAYCEFIIRGLQRLDQLFNFGLDRLIEDLRAEYMSLFGNAFKKERQ